MLLKTSNSPILERTGRKARIMLYTQYQIKDYRPNCWMELPAKPKEEAIKHVILNNKLGFGTHHIMLAAQKPRYKNGNPVKFIDMQVSLSPAGLEY